MTHIVTYTEARNNFKDTMDMVCSDHEPVIISRQRGQSVVILSLEDYNSIEETLYLLRSPENARRLEEAKSQIQAGNVVHKSIAQL